MLPALTAAAALVLALAACTPGGTEPEPTEGSAPATGDASPPAPSRTASPDPSASASSETGPGGTDESAALSDGDYGTGAVESDGFPDALEAPGEGAELLLEDVRVGVHDGFDRIVFDHTDGALPGYRVEYVEEPTEPGSGQPLEMAGSAYLAVHVTGLRPGMAGEEHGHTVLDKAWTGTSDVFQETVTTSVFEGASSYYVSLDEERGFSARMIEDGSRLVIDVRR
ncbi:hypothetical protein [Zhihengliuella sp.]|uniref:AMIN-like domain-containing (lipo)protein n=1 Tax=Zhihengliuella sp. TaxID=1954483 RepID=UPI0028116E34|nr:hypothetical protein [Zhihengliuella sp.]